MSYWRLLFSFRRLIFLWHRAGLGLIRFQFLLVCQSGLFLVITGQRWFTDNWLEAFAWLYLHRQWSYSPFWSWDLDLGFGLDTDLIQCYKHPHVCFLKLSDLKVSAAALAPKIFHSGLRLESKSLSLHGTQFFPPLFPLSPHSRSASLSSPHPQSDAVGLEGGDRIECPPFLPSPVKFQSQATLKGGIVSPWWGMPLRCSSKKRLHLPRNL